MPARPEIATDDEYRRVLRDAEYWEPWARAALEDAGLTQPTRMWIADPGTVPTLVCDTDVVVKVFGERFEGLESFAAESAAYTMLAGSALPVPERLAEGALYDAG